MFEAKYLHDEYFNLLLRLDGQPVKLQSPESRSFHTLEAEWCCGEALFGDGAVCNVQVKSEHRARSIHGLQRLLIMDEAQAQRREGVDIHKEFATFARRNMETLKPEIMFATRSSEADGEYIVLTTESQRNDSGGFGDIESKLVKR